MKLITFLLVLRSHCWCNTNSNTINVTGKFLIYGENGCPGQAQTLVMHIHWMENLIWLVSGLHHVILKGSGTNYKYTGVVDSWITCLNEFL
jgi:hypothetical protein